MNSELGRTSKTELKIWCTKRRGRIARKPDPARAPGPSRRPPVPGPGLGPRVPGRGHRPRALGPGLGLGSGAHRGISGPGGVMGGYMGLWGGRGADAFYWGGPKKLGPPRFLFLPSPWSSPSLANPAVKCLGAFHSFSISSAVFANSFVTSPSDVFCTANELPCHMFPRDRLPRNCPVFFLLPAVHAYGQGPCETGFHAPLHAVASQEEDGHRLTWKISTL